MSDVVQLRLEFQENTVADEVSAITAVVRPVLAGVLYALKKEVATELGGYENLKLFMLARNHRPGDGDTGICFEYAVHDALNTQNPMVMERVTDALRLCNVPGSGITSILFGVEKAGALNLIDTAKSLLTPESVLMYGTKGRPAKLRKHIEQVGWAFRRPADRASLPLSISGLWKADLFTGHPDTDRWIGTTLKINRAQLEGARGLRLGIVPTTEGASDAIKRDDTKNLVVCPLPYDGSFMEVFFKAWGVVVQFLTADARLPKEVALPSPAARQVARYLEERRSYPVLEVIDALQPLAQPHLLKTKEAQASVLETRSKHAETSALLAPMPRKPSRR